MKAVLLALKTCSQCGVVVSPSTAYYCDHCNAIYGDDWQDYADDGYDNLPQPGERRTL